MAGDSRDSYFTAAEGGLQSIQGIMGEPMDTFEDEDLREAEQIFVLAALLRTAKSHYHVVSAGRYVTLKLNNRSAEFQPNPPRYFLCSATDHYTYSAYL